MHHLALLVTEFEAQILTCGPGHPPQLANTISLMLKRLQLNPCVYLAALSVALVEGSSYWDALLRACVAVVLWHMGSDLVLLYGPRLLEVVRKYEAEEHEIAEMFD